MKETLYGISDLVRLVNDWASENKLRPATGQMSQSLTERTFRYYRTIGLLDPPVDGGLKYASINLAQLKAVRFLQSHGASLPKIRALILGKSEEELMKLISDGLKRVPSQPGFMLPPGEAWTGLAVADDCLLFWRRATPPSALQLEQIKAILNSNPKEN
jgi:DNA-binding transcriptional MerR regulator